MIKKPVTIQTNMDMETRPIAHLVQEASQYSSSVYIELDEKKINAKSIMGMMSLNLTKGTNLVVVATSLTQLRVWRRFWQSGIRGLHINYR